MQKAPAGAVTDDGPVLVGAEADDDRPETIRPVASARWARNRGRLTRAALLAAAAVVVGFVGLGLIGTLRVARSGVAGKRALLRAETDVRSQRVDAARQDLAAAAQNFRQMQHELHSFGPVVAVARAIPLVRVQVRAVQVFARAGLDLSDAGAQIVDATESAQRLEGAGAASSPVERLRRLQVSVHAGVQAIDSATAQLNTLTGFRLLGPLGPARSELSRRLFSIGVTARSADDGLAALIVFTGGSGPRHYLVLSQNPDEIRPTGGFIGSFGMLSGEGGQLHLDHYADIVEWTTQHPDVVVPLAQLGSPFRFYDPPLPQGLANVNATPDWPQVARAALALWRQGGQQADGVVSFTPEFMARVLAVIGPVAVPSYSETVTAQNVVERLNFYTHVQPPAPGSDRKAFLAPLGEAVMARLVGAPASQWAALGAALAKAFAARQLMVWSTDAAVESTLARRSWDGALPSAQGDFFSDGEFEYAAKNGRSITRNINHQVAIRADGSARITTTITFTNSEGPGPSNANPLLYVTVYGPAGAVLDPSASELVASAEPPLGGHPAAGWFIAVPPNGTATLKAVWDAPAVALRGEDGSWVYQLLWLHVVDNTGDVLNLQVDLPAHARWKGPPPPSHSNLTDDVRGTWSYRL